MRERGRKERAREEEGGRKERGQGRKEEEGRGGERRVEGEGGGGGRGKRRRERDRIPSEEFQVLLFVYLIQKIRNIHSPHGGCMVWPTPWSFIHKQLHNGGCHSQCYLLCE